MDFKEWEKKEEKRKANLREKYPNKKIKNIDIAHLRKIGYAIGLGSTLTKREFIDKIISMQDDTNPIIGIDADGNYGLFRDVELLKYIIKGMK